jgi:hypothetical protein
MLYVLDANLTLVLSMSMIALIVPAGRTLWEVSHGEHLKYKTIVLTPAFWRWMDPLLTIVLPLLSGASRRSSFSISAARLD